MELLDDDWLAALAECGSIDLSGVGTCSVRVDVSSAPLGTRTWQAVIAQGELRQVAAGAPEVADLTLTITWPDAVLVASGELGVNAAFMQGRLKTDGPTGPLLALLDALSREPAEVCRQALSERCSSRSAR
jgi:hypothetical protein